MCNYFFKYLEHKENSKSVEIYKSNEGDVFCFNDLTILHGRLAFTAKKKMKEFFINLCGRKFNNTFRINNMLKNFNTA